MPRNLMIATGLAALLSFEVTNTASAQPPTLRRHTTTQSAGELKLVPSTAAPPAASRVDVRIEGDDRVIRANGIPNHDTGPFPNRGNPHRIRPQDYVFRLPARPEVAREVTPLVRQPFGVAINGVVFDPGAAEFYRGNRHAGWQYEPLSGAVRLGIDASHAHVQPNGAYHYHGLPTGLFAEAPRPPEGHAPLIGWAADGFPIYAVHGFQDAEDPSSPVVALRSSYRLKAGTRPGGPEAPGGTYDGTFVADYEYEPKLGDLDACNGRHGVTPEFPEGTYAYFLTRDWPVIPRAFRGTPSADFERRGPGGPASRRRPRAPRG